MNLIAFNDKHFESLFYKNELLWIHISHSHGIVISKCKEFDLQLFADC